MAKIRRAVQIEEGASPIIRTIHGQGYHVVATVETDGPRNAVASHSTTIQNFDRRRRAVQSGYSRTAVGDPGLRDDESGEWPGSSGASRRRGAGSDSPRRDDAGKGWLHGLPPAEIPRANAPHPGGDHDRSRRHGGPRGKAFRRARTIFSPSRCTKKNCWRASRRRSPSSTPWDRKLDELQQA